LQSIKDIISVKTSNNNNLDPEGKK
jgi:hypothetical protein